MKVLKNLCLMLQVLVLIWLKNVQENEHWTVLALKGLQKRLSLGHFREITTLHGTG